MDGVEICSLVFDGAFATDYCGADGKLENMQTFECYGKNSATTGNVVYTIDAPKIVSTDKSVEYFGLRDIKLERSTVHCYPNNTWNGCTACNDKCGKCTFDNKDTCTSCNWF